MRNSSPKTLSEDDDPLDVLALSQELVAPLTIVAALAIGHAGVLMWVTQPLTNVREKLAG
ncbi:MAG: inorganic diphosphatase [Terracidiphilus sp.]